MLGRRVDAAEVVAALADDPLVTWLDRYGRSIGFVPDHESPAFDPHLDFLTFVAERAADFKRGVLRLLEQRSTVVRLPNASDLDEERQLVASAMRSGASIIHGAALFDDELGVVSRPTFLVRSDVLLQLVPSVFGAEVTWRGKFESDTVSPADIARLPAPGLDLPFHYRALEVRFAGLLLDRRGHFAGGGPLWLASRCLARLQGLPLPSAFVMGRSVTRDGTVERSCWERLAPAFDDAPHTRGRSLANAVTDALAWVRRVDAEGGGWVTAPVPSVPGLRPNMKNDGTRWSHAKKVIAAQQGELTTLWQVGVELRDRALAGQVPGPAGGFQPQVHRSDDAGLSSTVLGVTGPGVAPLLDAQLALRAPGAPGWSLGDGLDHEHTWQRPAPLELYVDFETVNDLDDDGSSLPWRGGQPLIFMAGVGWYDAAGEWVFRCFVADRLSVDAEGRLLEDFFACIAQQTSAVGCGDDNVRVFHWSAAEESMLDSAVQAARQRHPEKTWPKVPWFDFLSRVVKRAPFVVRGANGFGLKSIGKALHSQGAIGTSWADGPADGMGAMVAAWRAEAVARTTGKRLLDVPALAGVVAYNEVDCRVMAEVVAFVRAAASGLTPTVSLGPLGATPIASPTAALAPPEAPLAAPPPSPVLTSKGSMKILAPGERAIDELTAALPGAERLDCLTPAMSLPAMAALLPALATTKAARVVVPGTGAVELGLFGDDADRVWRNRLEQRITARRLADWLTARAEVRAAPTNQAMVVVRATEGPSLGLTGTPALTTRGLGLAPADMQFVQVFNGLSECAAHGAYFDGYWQRLGGSADAKDHVLQTLRDLDTPVSPAFVYFLILQQLFGRGDDLDEDRIVNAATGIKDTAVWQKLYRFQRDGVIGAIDKLQKYGGCIIADSVGLGKTFEALAVVKYYELRNNRVLVLCPKRLRDNWTLYKSNDQRNVLADDRLHYDVLNHTDLTRDGGFSGDIDLSNVKWGNYDLIVIDESHNFRNRPANKGRKTRYEHLMESIIKSGVKTRVLMLSATPVNNRLADLKNQILFATEGDDAALSDRGIGSIERTTRAAQMQFNRWLDLDDEVRTSAQLIEMLGFDYFKLLDLLTIARSRKHVERYYGTSETGRFPERLKPRNITADMDNAGTVGSRVVPGTGAEIPTRSMGEYTSIREINAEIRRLNLSAYSPLKYVLPSKRAAYDAKYATSKDGKQLFAQSDRENSLIHLLRVNLLKRMESAVTSFKLTLQRQLADVEGMLEKLKAHEGAVSFWGDEASIADIDIDDPDFDALLVGEAIKVSLHDLDRVRWQQDLQEDQKKLARMLAAAEIVSSARDDKLQTLRRLIEEKAANPINEGNHKVIIFSAFADTASYLYEHIAEWAKDLGLQTALVTGGGRNRSTLPGLRADLSSILTAFSPRSKNRPAALADTGDLDILIATDCISEGQNLQDCDTLINYDIHWNPVRVIQRFGRIDRIGSTNALIQMINFWPNMELDEYIDLERRVTARMALVDVSATGEENLFDGTDRVAMNDLEYRRRQLLKLKDEVIDLEDLSNGVSISDLTLNDFRLDLARFCKEEGDVLAHAPLGIHAVTTAVSGVDSGVIFCLQACGAAANTLAEPGYPLSPHFLVHVGDNGASLLPYTQAKQVLERLKRLCLHQGSPDEMAVASFDKLTKSGADMALYQRRLAVAVAAITGKKEERAVASLFSSGPTHAKKGEFAGTNDFEVVAFVVVLPEPATAGTPAAST